MPTLRRDGDPDPDSVIGAIELQRDAPLDVFTDGEPWRVGDAAGLAERSERRFADGGRAELERLRSLAPSWARLKMTVLLDGVRETSVERANQLLGWGVDYLAIDAREYGQSAPAQLLELIEGDRELLAGLVVPENATSGIYLGESSARTLAGLAHDGRTDVLQALFALPVERFLIGFADAEHDLSFLAQLPEERFAVLGLIDAGSPQLEDHDEVLATMDAAGAVHGERLAVCPSRGFADLPPREGMTLALQRKKLELVSDVARMVWGTEL
jgi:hypothetical protein